jgi:predicted Rossmann fold flavoprotein
VKCILILGGGAAGFFAALAAKKNHPDATVLILEKNAQLLAKVRISGGGRCNVTHACFEPSLLVQNYPRGNKELLGPFHQFQPKDTIAWFKERGVQLKQEEDGRMFPTTDSSETIIQCFMDETKKRGVEIRTLVKLEAIEKQEGGFLLKIRDKDPIFADRLILATGSAKSGLEFAKELGHTLQPPVPSLFTFNIPSFPLTELAGVSVDPAQLQLEGSKWKMRGPLLITHWGFSGPVTLKLSAFAARYLAEKNYETTLLVDWLAGFSEDALRARIHEEQDKHPKKQLGSLHLLPKKLWKALCARAGLQCDLSLKAVNPSLLTKLCHTLKQDRFQMQGKTTHKEEFVTCGGVTLSEVNFKTMESKVCPHLYFCGEILDIDGITGGFNFQNAWTTGWIAGSGI